jgi:hypothetical protein
MPYYHATFCINLPTAVATTIAPSPPSSPAPDDDACGIECVPGKCCDYCTGGDLGISADGCAADQCELGTDKYSMAACVLPPAVAPSPTPQPTPAPVSPSPTPQPTPSPVEDATTAKPAQRNDDAVKKTTFVLIVPLDIDLASLSDTELAAVKDGLLDAAAKAGKFSATDVETIELLQDGKVVGRHRFQRANSPITARIVFKDDADVDLIEARTNLNTAIKEGTVAVSVVIGGVTLTVSITETVEVTIVGSGDLGSGIEGYIEDLSSSVDTTASHLLCSLTLALWMTA